MKSNTAVIDKLFPTNKPNAEQIEAIITTEGPLLIIAGPGSGKSTTLVNRIVYLLIEKKVNPENILISTFTEKAARELVSKISDQILSRKLKINLDKMCIGTMHSIFLHLLEEFRDYTELKRNYRVLDQFEQQYIIFKNIFHFRQIDTTNLLLQKKTSWWNQAGTIAQLVNKCSEEGISTDELKKNKTKKLQILLKFYEKYIEILDEENALDFSRIQTDFLKLIEEHKDVREELQERFQYMMIDEYQDTNSIQEKILLTLLNKQKNICVVGDDDQALYRFRGASVRNILEFEKHFKGKCKLVKLTKNYRSHSKIIDFYNDFMEQGDWIGKRKQNLRYPKTIVSGKDLKKEQNYPAVMRCSAKLNNKDDSKWCSEVKSCLEFLKKNKIVTDWNQVVFLFRSVKHNHAVNLAKTLEEAGINVYTPRSSLFFERDEILYAFGALFCVFQDFIKDEYKKDESLEAFVDKSVKKFRKDCLKNDPNLKDFLKLKISEVKNISNENLDYAFSGLLYQLFKFDFLAKYLKNDNIDEILDTRPARNLSIMTSLLTKFEDLENISVLTKDYIGKNIKKFVENYLSFLVSGGIEEYEDDEITVPSGCVSFMTIHQSKGLEFPIVFVCSLWDKPRSKLQKEIELDELLNEKILKRNPFEDSEKIKYYDFYRLYYTAFSRPKNLLFLSCPEKYNKNGTLSTPTYPFEESYTSIPTWQSLKNKKEIWSTIPSEKVNFNPLRKSYSFTSHILLYEGCPLQYKFFKELDFSPVRTGTVAFGSLVHETIEDIHKAVIKDKKIKITKEKITDWFNQNYEDMKKSEHVFLKESSKKSAIEQILRYAEAEKENWGRIHKAEEEVSLVEKGYILKGKIDLIRNENGKIEILDFKAEKKPDVNDPADKNRIEQYKRQLQIYAHIIEGETGEPVEKMHLYYTGTTDGSPYISFKRDASQVEKTIEKVSEVVQKIENHNYRISERNHHYCHNCDMRHFCNEHTHCSKKSK